MLFILKPNRRESKVRRLIAMGTIVGMVAALAACSSSKAASSGASGSESLNSSSTPATATTASCISAADQYLKPWDTLATTLPAAFTPLAQTPAPGKTVIDVTEPVVPENVADFGQLQTAAKSIKWTAKLVGYNGTVADLSAKVSEAVSDKPAVIIIDAPPSLGVIAAPLQAAKNAGIVVAIDSAALLPTSNPGFAALFNGPQTFELVGTLNAYLFMRASSCAGSVALAVPAGFPQLDAENNSFISTVHKYCPKCTIATDSIQVQDIGTPAATQSVVGQLKADPKIKYVFAVGIANIVDGLQAALTQVGLSGVAIFGTSPDVSAMTALRDGSNPHGWWVNQNGYMNEVGSLDAALRAIESHGLINMGGDDPLGVFTAQNVPSTGIPPTPEDYLTEFERLWGVA
jgi:hypothetical protein